MTTLAPATDQQQGDLLDMLAELPDPGDSGPRVAAIAALLTGDPVHYRDRQRITAAILRDAARNGGEVDPGRVRASLCDTRGNLVVAPRVLSACYLGLAARGVIRFDRWGLSNDVRGRNQGKPCRIYHLGNEWSEVAA